MTSLDEFYGELVRTLQAQSVPCAITGGLACVEFGVMEHTADCDLLCAPSHARALLEILTQTQFEGTPCHYRSLLSAPLDARWITGGWTSHFQWEAGLDECPFLDVFGVPPRATSPWLSEVVGRLAGRHTVAEMKRTRRRKDWDQATALGLQMIQLGDDRGWLHVFDAEALRALVSTVHCPPGLFTQRPALRLAVAQSAWLDRVIQIEVEFWTQLDRLRLKVYEDSVRPYSAALRHDPRLAQAPLEQEHRVRLVHAEEFLPGNPVGDYGVDRLIAEARAATSLGLNPELLQWLPDAGLCFGDLKR